MSDLFAKRHVGVRSDHKHHVETAWESCSRIAVVIKAKYVALDTAFSQDHAVAVLE